MATHEKGTSQKEMKNNNDNNNNNKKEKKKKWASCRITTVGPIIIHRNLKDKKAQSLQGMVRLVSSIDDMT